MRDTPEWRNWQTRLTQNQVLRSVGSSPTSGTNAKAAGKLQAFPPLLRIYFYANPAHPRIRCGNNKDTRNRRPAVRVHGRAAVLHTERTGEGLPSATRRKDW